MTARDSLGGVYEAALMRQRRVGGEHDAGDGGTMVAEGRRGQDIARQFRWSAFGESADFWRRLGLDIEMTLPKCR